MPRVERLPSGSFRIRYSDPWGRRRSITARSAADVRARYKRISSDITRGEYVDPRAGRVTVEVWAEDWLLGARNVGAGGRDMYRQALAHILPELGRIPIGKLSAVDIDRYLERKLRATPPPEAGVRDARLASTGPYGNSNIGLAPSTVHRHYRTLHRMLAVAVERGVIARNPCEHVQPPKVTRPDITVLDVGQIDQLADAITPRYRAWVYVAAYGGLRWSETVGLRRVRVDLPRIIVAGQLVRRRDGSWDRCEPKVGSRRMVTLPGFAAAELAQHLDEYSLPGPDGLVFPTRNGTPMYGGSWTTSVFKAALRRAGLPDIRIHDLRHTSVSLALAAGARLEVVQERHGHSSIRVTADTYGHMMAGADETVATALEQLRANERRTRLRVV